MNCIRKQPKTEIKITLKTPLVIPQDCLGSVTMEGSDEVDTLLDGSKFTGGGR